MAQSRSSWNWHLGLASSLAMGGAIAISTDYALTQPTPDATLGGESSVVIPLNTLVDQIEGGAIRGTNLFHSFLEFSVEEGRGAYFTNPAGIENILSRVTGGNPSNILGTLGVSGNANLFLINPNGIIFGSNARLDVRGSFMATTANAVRLGETGLFSASEPATSNLLTVSPSAFFFNTVPAQAIVNRSQAQNLSEQTNSVDGPVGLQVPTSQTLAFVGGDVVLKGGNLTAAGGHIELGSVAGIGEVSLSQIGNSWVLGYNSIDVFGNIRLEGGAFVNATGEGGGSLQIQGALLELSQGARIYADTRGTGAGGEVLVHTTKAVTISDGSQITTDVTSIGTGTGGNLTIETGQLSVQGSDSRIRAGTFGKGQGGDLTVTASESVELMGIRSGLFTETQGAGDAGNLTVATRWLSVGNGAVVSASTSTEGQGGNLVVTASDSVELVGRSGLFAQTQGAGAAGDLTIATKRLSVQDGALISNGTFGSGKGGNLTVTGEEFVELLGSGSGLFTQTQGAGNAGNLTVATQQLSVQNGAVVSASTSTKGQGGDLTITDSDSVELVGTGSGLSTQTQGAGDAGNLTVETERLTVRDGAGVYVRSQGLKNAGNLEVRARSISLDNQGNLIATTKLGKGGGNITLQEVDLLLLRRNSGISTNAGGFGNGGDITINTDLLAALEDSNITANAVEGRGGNIQINTQGRFLSPDSDITASSQLGIDGVVEINTPDTDPSSGLVVLPEELVDVTGLIAQGCQAGGGDVGRVGSEFTIAGRGGLPPQPSEALRTLAVVVNGGMLETGLENRSESATSTPVTYSTPTPLVEAQGWVVNAQGQVVLTASGPSVTPDSSESTPPQCHAS